MEKIISARKVATLAVIVLIISLIPILFMSFFNYATGDDLWKGWRAHRVIIESGGLDRFISAVAAEASEEYMGWEGTWFSNIILAMPPNVFSERVYIITTWLALLFFMGGTWLFLNCILHEKIHMPRSYVVILYSVLCFFSIQYIPYIRGGLFWYTGVAHYQFPYGIALVSLVLLIKYLDDGRKSFWLLLLLSMFYLGGSHYQAMVLNFWLYFWIVFYYLLNNRENTHRFQRIVGSIIPFMVGIAGFVVCAIAPGNNVRASSDGTTMQLSFDKIVGVLQQSIFETIGDAAEYFLNKRLLILLVIIVIIVALLFSKNGNIHISLKQTLIFTVIGVTTIIGVHAPGIYGGNNVSGGVPNTNYFVFLLIFELLLIAWTIFFENKFKSLEIELIRKIAILFGLMIIVFIPVSYKHWFSQTSNAICIDFIRSGQLKDFISQMEERLEILNDPSIDNVVVYEMNDQQGPYMHMALMSDPDAWINQNTEKFYGKKSIIAIPRP